MGYLDYSTKTQKHKEDTISLPVKTGRGFLLREDKYSAAIRRASPIVILSGVHRRCSYNIVILSGVHRRWTKSKDPMYLKTDAIWSISDNTLLNGIFT